MGALVEVVRSKYKILVDSSSICHYKILIIITDSIWNDAFRLFWQRVVAESESKGVGKAVSHNYHGKEVPRQE